MPAFIQSATFPFGVDQFLLRDAGSPVFGGEDDCDVPAEDFLPGEPEGFLRAGIPVLDAALGVEREDGEILEAGGGKARSNTFGKAATRSIVDVPRRSKT